MARPPSNTALSLRFRLLGPITPNVGCLCATAICTILCALERARTPSRSSVFEACLGAQLFLAALPSAHTDWLAVACRPTDRPMDPATALGIASAVTGLVGFSSELVTSVGEVLFSRKGQTADNAHVFDIISDLRKASARLARHADKQQRPLTQPERHIYKLSRKCHKKCIKLEDYLYDLKAHSKTPCGILRSVLQARLQREEVQQMVAHVRDYQSNIVFWTNQLLV